MADEQESVAPVEVTPEAPPVEQQPETDLTQDLEELRLSQYDEEDAPEPETAEEPAEELDDYEDDGKKYKVPKALVPKLMKDADYTRKTQEVAALRKAAEAHLTEVKQTTEAEIEARANLHSLNKELKPYAELTAQQWEQWSSEDPIAAQQGFMRFEMLKGEQQSLSQQLAAKQHERSVAAQSEATTRIQETEEAAKKLPGWSPEKHKDVIDFAKSQGLTQEFLRENINPAYYGILYKAMLGDQAMKRPATPKPVVPTIPLTVVGAKKNAPVAKTIAEMDMKEYAAAYKKREAAKAR